MIGPSVAFTAKSYKPGGVVGGTLTVRLDVALPPDDRLTLRGLRDSPIPARLLLQVRLANPANRFTLVSVIVDHAERP